MENNHKIITWVTRVVVLVLLVLVGCWVWNMKVPNQFNLKHNNPHNYQEQKPMNTPQQEPIKDMESMIFPEEGQAGYFVLTENSDWHKLNEHWEMRLISVGNDSRCPEMVTCEWAGEAEAKVEFRQSNNPETIFDSTMKVRGLNRYQGQLKENLFMTVTIPNTSWGVSANSPDTANVELVMADLLPRPKMESMAKVVIKGQYHALFKIIQK